MKFAGPELGGGFRTSARNPGNGERSCYLKVASHFPNFLADVFAVFMFVLWFWLFIITVSDLFRRHDVSRNSARYCWVILLIILPYIGIFAYLLTQGRGMAERNEARARQTQEDLRKFVGFSAADGIEKLDRLKAAGSISEQEYGRLRARLVQ